MVVQRGRRHLQPTALASAARSGVVAGSSLQAPSTAGFHTERRLAAYLFLISFLFYFVPSLLPSRSRAMRPLSTALRHSARRASTSAGALSRTPLYALHQEHQAKLSPFAGFMMPLYYDKGGAEEHRHVRNKAGLFDVSHMVQSQSVLPHTMSDSLQPS